MYTSIIYIYTSFCKLCSSSSTSCVVIASGELVLLPSSLGSNVLEYMYTSMTYIYIYIYIPPSTDSEVAQYVSIYLEYRHISIIYIYVSLYIYTSFYRLCSSSSTSCVVIASGELLLLPSRVNPMYPSI